MIDWNKLKPYRTDRRKSFEELVYQIARQEYNQQGRFTRVDDSGGGDGVEFYLTLEDGSEWGWQAKFYTANDRLAQGGRKAQITRSLRRSVEKHLRLSKWFLCTASNLTAEEIKWFNEELLNQAPGVELDHWGDSELQDFLARPEYGGKKSYFFGDLELTAAWFRDQVQKQLDDLGNKYIAELHTPSNFDDAVHMMLFNEDAVKAVNILASALRGGIDNLKKSLLVLDEWAPEAAQATLKPVLTGRVNEVLAHTSDWLALVNPLLDQPEIYESLHLTYPQLYSAASGLARAVEEYSDIIRKYKIEDITECRRPRDIMDRCISIITDITKSLKRIKTPALHIFGDGGVGKTHSAAHIAKTRTKDGIPTILLLGEKFHAGSTIENQILELLDVPSTFSWLNFLDALDSAAKAFHTKIPIIIDALNEAEDVSFWQTHIRGFIGRFRDKKSVCIVTTCRSHYREAIWGHVGPENVVNVPGVGRHNIDELINKYFCYYRIETRTTYRTRRLFATPIFLKIFCETINPERREIKEVTLVEQTRLDIIERYLDLAAERVCKRIDQDPHEKAVQQRLRLLAGQLWNSRDRHIDYEAAKEIMDQGTISQWSRAYTNAILGEGLIIQRTVLDRMEKVTFTYDLMAGFLIAKYLLGDRNTQEMQQYLASEGVLNNLFGKDTAMLHPLWGDILSSLSVLLPRETGKHLYQLVKTRYGPVIPYSIWAFFEIESIYITPKEIGLARRIFAQKKRRGFLFDLLLKKAIRPGHPLNFEFWSCLLGGLEMAERDITWTEWIRRASEEVFEYIDETQGAFRHAVSNSRSLDPTLGRLCAIYLMWLLTSTIRPLRDKATRALYWYGRLFPNDLLDLTLDSFRINDPYVPERMLAALYGVCMALHPWDPAFRDEVLPEIGRRIYESMFRPGATHGTTHVLMRNYARLTVDLALKYHPQLLEQCEVKYLRPPFDRGGIRHWGRLSEDEYKTKGYGDTPMHMDFRNYTLGHLVPGRANYDFNHKGWQMVHDNILWRVSELGYRNNLFAEPDNEIGRGHIGRGHDPGKTDRYGKKYCWIAYYELFGYRIDRGLLKDRWGESRLPQQERDIDPSFPEEPHKLEIIKGDYLGDRDQPLSDWIQHGTNPDPAPYLIQPSIDGVEGPWVLLDGYLNQEDLSANRAIFVFLRTFLVRVEDCSDFITWLRGQHLGGHWLPEIPEDYYLFGGEIPWSETYAWNGRTTIGFAGNSGSGLARRAAKFSTLIPIRENCWESYHSLINPGQNAAVLARDLAEPLGLWIKPQSFDFFEANGQRASFLSQWGSSLRNTHHVMYFRQDLLERLLRAGALRLVWAVWGERESRFEDHEKASEFAEKSESYANFQMIAAYRESISPPASRSTAPLHGPGGASRA